PDRWNTSKLRERRSTRSVNGEFEIREKLRRALMRRPAGEFDSRARKHPTRLFGKISSMDASLEAQSTDGLDQKLVQILRALAFFPIPDPNKVASEVRGGESGQSGKSNRRSRRQSD